MKLILESWRRFLKEEVENNNLHIFFDMDGVLVDLATTLANKININLKSAVDPHAATHDEHGEILDRGSKSGRKGLRKLKALVTEVTPEQLEDITIKKDAGESRSPEEKAINNYVYALLGDKTGQIWLDMEVAPGAQEMIDAAKEKGNIYVLSSPVGDISVEKKKQWLKNKLPGVEFVDTIFSSKKGEALKNTGLIQRGETVILIDDRVKYINDFVTGGQAAAREAGRPEEVYKLVQTIHHYPAATPAAVSKTLVALGEL